MLTNMVGSLYNKQCTHCGGYHTYDLPIMSTTDKIPPVYEELLKKLYNGTNDTTDTPTMLQVARHIMEAIFTGYGGKFEDFDFDTPDYNMLARLERDVYSFSYAKNHQMMKALTLQLKDGDRVRSFTEFRKEAAKTMDEWVGNWLRTEYDTAIASAQMASRWVEYERDADILPMLEYQTAGDERVRASHKVLNGIVKPVNHSFWDTHYPPNGWGCRCDVVQAYGAKETADEDITTPEIPDMFATNLAKHGQAFPKDHPYYKGIPKAEIERYVLNLPPERQFEETYRNGNGVVRQHLLADIEAKDFKTVHQIALDKADKGHMVEIMPVISPKDTEARKLVFKGAKELKNPDLRIDGTFVEVERPMTVNINAISRRIKSGYQQADHVILSLPDGVDRPTLQNIARGRFNTHDGLKSVEYEYKGGYLRFERE